MMRCEKCGHDPDVVVEPEGNPMASAPREGFFWAIGPSGVWRKSFFRECGVGRFRSVEVHDIDTDGHVSPFFNAQRWRPYDVRDVDCKPAETQRDLT